MLLRRNPEAWIPNRERPSLWCRIFHRGWWLSNDFGTWHVSGRTDFEVCCLRCAGCWREKV